MKKLKELFGDRTKVIRGCMAEVNNFSKVSPNDYKNLVLLKLCIEINYTRLKSCDLKGEISNTQTMKSIEAKFPPVQQIEWTKYLQALPKERQVTIFPEFLGWLEKEGNVWAAMEAKGLSSQKSSKTNTTLYRTEDKPSPEGNCFNCNKD